MSELRCDQWRCDNCGHINRNADIFCVVCWEEANERFTVIAARDSEVAE